MKRLIMAVAGLACVTSVVSAQVTSANIVGYTKVPVVGGELSLVAVNFDTGGAVLSDVIGTSVPALSFVYKWDKDSSQYVPSSLNTRGAWSPNFTVDLGDALWIVPAGSATNDIIFSGEVLLGDSVLTVPASASMNAYGYPVETDITATQIGDDLPALSFIYTWDSGLQSYVPVSKNTRGAWSGSAVVSPSEGFWIINSGVQVDITNSVPFTP